MPIVFTFHRPTDNKNVIIIREMVISVLLIIQGVQKAPAKVQGDRTDPTNNCPLAITSIVCKVLEQVLNKSLIEYLEDHTFISDRQYGFRSKRLTGEAIDKYVESLAVSLDTAKAFYRVWLKALLS